MRVCVCVQAHSWMCVINFKSRGHLGTRQSFPDSLTPSHKHDLLLLKVSHCWKCYARNLRRTTHPPRAASPLLCLANTHLQPAIIIQECQKPLSLITNILSHHSKGKHRICDSTRRSKKHNLLVSYFIQIKLFPHSQLLRIFQLCPHRWHAKLPFPEIKFKGMANNKNTLELYYESLLVFLLCQLLLLAPSISMNISCSGTLNRFLKQAR